MGIASLFGEDNPHMMPPHLFSSAVRLDYASAVRGDITKQNCSVAPRYWYVDATVKCVRCGNEFCFSVAEQKTWYEEYGFFVDSFPKRCLTCRQQVENIKALRQEYDRNIDSALRSADLEVKKRLLTVIRELCEMNVGLQPRVHENRKTLAAQIARYCSTPL